MRKHPLFWGVVVFLIAGSGWFLSVILSVLTAGAFRNAANVCGIIAAAALPVTAVAELIRTFRTKK